MFAQCTNELSILRIIMTASLKIQLNEQLLLQTFNCIVSYQMKILDILQYQYRRNSFALSCSFYHNQHRLFREIKGRRPFAADRNSLCRLLN